MGIEKESLLLHAAALGDNMEVCRFIVEESTNINAVNMNGSSCCHIAAQKKYLALLKDLIEKGADLNIQEKFDVGGYTPLMYAVENNNLAMAELLLRHDADPNIADSRMWFSPLHHCARGGEQFITMTKKLMDHGANPDARDKEGNNAAYWAQELDNHKFLKIAGMPKPAILTAAERFQALQLAKELKAAATGEKKKKGGKKGGKKGKKGGKKKKK
jgi:ankyrin repeat protein